MKQTLFEKNIAFLDEKFAGMGSLVLKKSKEIEEEIELEEGVSADGQVLLRVSRGDRAWFLNGRRNALEPVKKWTENIEKIVKGASVSLIGIGNGSYLEQLVSIAEENVRFVVYEPSIRIFLTAMKCIDLKVLSEKNLLVFVVEGVNQDGLAGIYENIFEHAMLAKCHYFIHPNYQNIFQEKTLEATKALRRKLSGKMVNFNTNMRFADVVVQNLINSMKYLPDIYKTSQLAGVIPFDMPAIVVAAGPSLNKNIEDLKLAKNKAFIIAADTAVKPLLKAGIVPDMLAMVDGKKPLHLFEAEGVADIPLVTSVLAAGEVMDYHKGKKFIYNESMRMINYAFGMNKLSLENLRLGGSVATAAFSLCYMIGLTTIILVGQDLALTGNKSHADGTFKDKMEEVDTTRYPMVEGNYEELVPTRGDFLNYLEWYNNYIETGKKNRNIRVINATEGGAKIKGTEIMTLKEAIAEVCTKEVDIEALIRDVKPVFNEEQREKVVDYLHEIPKKFGELERDAQKAEKLYEKLLSISKKNGTDDKAYQKVYDKLKKVNRKLESNLVYDTARLVLVNADVIMQMDQFNSEDTVQQEIASVATKGKKYMEMVRTCALLFKPLAEEALADVK